MFVQIQKSMMIYFRKHRGVRDFATAKAIYVLSKLSRAAIWYAKYAFNRQPRLRLRVLAALAALRFHIFGTEPS